MENNIYTNTNYISREIALASGINSLGREIASTYEPSLYKPNVTYVHITDKDYFFMLENQIKKEMSNYEESIMLPKSENILIANNIRNEELLDFPIEGYYYKTDNLKRFFKISRNIQENRAVYKRINITKEVNEFIKFFENDIFGKEPSNRLGDAIMPRRKDILTLTMEDPELFNLNHPRPWQIDDVMSKLKYHYTDTINLVELAYLTKERECLICGAETNALYRDFNVCISGCYLNTNIIEYVWDVKPEVEDMGKRLIESYNKLIDSKMISPDLKNHLNFDKNSKRPRIAHLGLSILTGEYYFWHVNESGTTGDFYDTEFFTTETYYRKNGYKTWEEINPFQTIFYKNILN